MVTLYDLPTKSKRNSCIYISIKATVIGIGSFCTQFIEREQKKKLYRYVMEIPRCLALCEYFSSKIKWICIRKIYFGMQMCVFECLQFIYFFFVSLICYCYCCYWYWYCGLIKSNTWAYHIGVNGKQWNLSFQRYILE